MSGTDKNRNLKYSAQSILNGIHRSDPSVLADVNILIDAIEEIDDIDMENTLYALESLKEYLEDGSRSNLSRRDAEIFAHYVRDKFFS